MSRAKEMKEKQNQKVTVGSGERRFGRRLVAAAERVEAGRFAVDAVRVAVDAERGRPRDASDAGAAGADAAADDAAAAARRRRRRQRPAALQLLQFFGHFVRTVQFLLLLVRQVQMPVDFAIKIRDRIQVEKKRTRNKDDRCKEKADEQEKNDRG